jgi:hypothetical protein
MNALAVPFTSLCDQGSVFGPPHATGGHRPHIPGATEAHHLDRCATGTHRRPNGPIPRATEAQGGFHAFVRRRLSPPPWHRATEVQSSRAWGSPDQQAGATAAQQRHALVRLRLTCLAWTRRPCWRCGGRTTQVPARAHPHGLRGGAFRPVSPVMARPAVVLAPYRATAPSRSVLSRDRGRRTLKVEPTPSSLDTASSPPCARTIQAAIASPRPAPPAPRSRAASTR